MHRQSEGEWVCLGGVKERQREGEWVCLGGSERETERGRAREGDGSRFCHRSRAGRTRAGWPARIQKQPPDSH